MNRICLLIPSLELGGMERVMSELINEFAKSNSMEVHLVLYGITRGIFYSVPSMVRVHKPPFHFNDRWRTFYTVRTMWYLRRELQAIAPDSILSFGEIWNNFVLLSTLGMHLPIFVSDRSSPAKKLPLIQEGLRALLYKRAKGVIVQTQAARAIYARKFVKADVCVIGNPIRAIHPPESVHRENIVLSVGRLIESKHHESLIRLFLKLSIPGWRLVIIGDDAQKQKVKAKLETLIQHMGGGQKVTLAGTQRDVDGFYLKSKIFASMSSSEGFPNVLGEAMAAGLPVIAFDCVAGPSELITDGENGFLVPLFDYDSYEKKLRSLMTDEQLRVSFGNEAKERVKRFSTNTVAQQYHDFILDNETTPSKFDC